MSLWAIGQVQLQVGQADLRCGWLVLSCPVLSCCPAGLINPKIRRDMPRQEGVPECQCPGSLALLREEETPRLGSMHPRFLPVAKSNHSPPPA